MTGATVTGVWMREFERRSVGAALEPPDVERTLADRVRRPTSRTSARIGSRTPV